jgi:hypothetical protein
MSEILEPAAEGQPSGGLPPLPQAVLHMLRHFAMLQRRARFDLGEFAGFVKVNLGRFLLNFPQLEELAQRTEVQLSMHLRALAERGLCRLEYDGPEVVGILYPGFFSEIVRKLFAALEQRPQEPFPNEKGLGFTVPEDLVQDVDIKSEFVNLLVNPRVEGPEVLRLGFPDGLPQLLVTPDLLKGKLLEASLAKLREYLGNRNNAGYVMHRLLPALRGNDHVLRDTLNAIITRSGRALGSLTEPTDFSFRFWAHFANLVVQDYRERTDRNAEENGYCQAAYLAGYYNVYYRGRVQSESEKTTVLKRFDLQLRKAPYAYTLRDFYGVKDEKGLPLVRASTQEVFLKFLEERTRLEGGQGLPELVRLKTASGQEYYLARELIIPFFLKRLYERREQVRERYIDAWSAAIREGRRLPAMRDDREYLRDLEAVLRGLDPLLHALLNYSILFLAREHAKLKPEQQRELGRCLDEAQGRIATLDQVLQLPRKELVEDARLRVPVWQRYPLFKRLVNWLRSLFQGSGERAGSGEAREESREEAREGGKAAEAAPKAGGKDRRPAAAAKEEAGTTTASPISARQLAVYRNAVQGLKAQFVGDKSVPQRLGELAEKWNPLYDPKARTDLVEDVNAMIRDYLRSLRRGFRLKPPDAARLQALAVQVSQNKAFERIKRKDLFLRYIEVYMIKILGEG